MKNLLVSLICLLNFNAFAEINRCEIYNKEICQSLTTEWGQKPNREMVYFIKAIIEKESGWDTDSSRTEPSGKTSYGLMHVMDETAIELGLANPKALYRPSIGIKYGVKYATKQLKNAMNHPNRAQFSVWKMAAAGYNSGSIRLRRNGTLISNRDSLGGGMYLTYEDAIFNLMEDNLRTCANWNIAKICQ
jgi:hypothetical protein